MENFEFEKSTYLSELRDVLFTEGLSILEYAEELGEENINLIKNPKNFRELNLVKRALEVFLKLKELSKTEEFDAENNSAYTVEYLTIKGPRNEQYFDYACEIRAHMLSSEYLRGKFIVDGLCVPDEALKSILEYEEEKSDGGPEFIMHMLAAPLYVEFRTAKLCQEMGIELPEMQDEVEEGIPTYLLMNESVFTYLRERELNPEENEYVRKYRIDKGI